MVVLFRGCLFFVFYSLLCVFWLVFVGVLYGWWWYGLVVILGLNDNLLKLMFVLFFVVILLRFKYGSGLFGYWV